jgi:N-acetylglucosaminyldiphosphoundecaprenol N-acetyl-beta-D-mannosaminyltransferase
MLALGQIACRDATLRRASTARRRAPRLIRVAQPSPQPVTPAVPPTVRVAGIEIAVVSMLEAVDATLGLAAVGEPQLVVTPNVDHVIVMERDSEFAAAYSDAALRLADGAPLVFLSRLLGTPLPERVTGVDLTNALLRRCEQSGESIFLFGGSPCALSSALARIAREHPRVTIAGAASPTVNLERSTGEEAEALAMMRAAQPDVVLVFLGSPKGEKWFLRRRAELAPSVFISVGGTVDFLAGTARRAPGWIQSLGFEWLWRLAHEPRRLFGRYIVRDSRFAVIAARELLTRWRRSAP